MSKYNIYALLLNHNKYYIGKTKKEVVIRLYDHKLRPTNNWLKTYKPIKINEEYESSDPFAEDNLTKKYMATYGIDNVRGGSYTKFDLEKEEKKLLQKEISSLGDKCFNCNKPGHFANECPEKKHTETYKENIKFRDDILEDLSLEEKPAKLKKEIYKDEIYDVIYTNKNININDSKLVIKDNYFSEITNMDNHIICYKCGSIGHLSTNCYNFIIKDPKLKCKKCGALGHLSKECETLKNKNKCFRCGKSGHYANECYF